jgi:hypothetical protein
VLYFPCEDTFSHKSFHQVVIRKKLFLAVHGHPKFVTDCRVQTIFFAMKLESIILVKRYNGILILQTIQQ